MNWGSFFSGLTSLGTSIATDVSVASGPTTIPGAPGVVYLPQSGQVINTNTLLGSGGGSSIFLILLIGAALFFAFRK